MLDQILLIIAGLAGLGSLVTMIVNALKLIPGVIQDGISDKIATGVDLVVFIVVGILYFLKVEVDWDQVDSYLHLATYVLGLVIQIFSTRITHQVVRGTPVIGTTFETSIK